MSLKGFVAYPSNPPEIGSTIQQALKIRAETHAKPGLDDWAENDIAGRCLADPILEKIAAGQILVADVTRLNFNVTYEIGFALGVRRRLYLIRNSAITGDDGLVREVGLFDTLGYESYDNAKDLAALLYDVQDVSPITYTVAVTKNAPVYIIMPRHKADSEIRLFSRIKKARINFRTFDAEEQGRLGYREAVDNVARSLGVVAPLLSSNRVEAKVHNLRCAFVAGLADGMDKELLLLQAGDEPVPLDYRDRVHSYYQLEQIDAHVADFASRITESLQSAQPAVIAEPATFLAKLTLGSSITENEMDSLGHYYVETEEFWRTSRGEVQIVAGRKGAGKTALFAQLRDKLRRDTANVVLDLKPEGFQLLKFKEVVLDRLAEGTREHTITAFWEYLLYLETCYKLLEKDRELHVRQHTLYEPYRKLESAYKGDRYIAEGDFAERMLQLTQRIEESFRADHAPGETNLRLSNEQTTELLYRHDVARLRDLIVEYLGNKKGLWILFDNLDKGWPPYGLTAYDLTLVRCLLDALAKIERAVQRRKVGCHGIVFIRNDVYEMLVDSTPDRGKLSRITLDWADDMLLRELLRRRIVYGGDIGKDTTFEEIWPTICLSHVHGEESSQYLVERCLMRPRALLELVQYCKAHAINLRHAKIELEDIEDGEKS